MAVGLIDDNVLDLFDQAFFAGHEAVGQKEIMQVGWVYRHPVDLTALRLFHRNLGSGLLGRRIERSPLPFGRHRWVSDRGPTDLEVADHPRPRSELGEWFDECAYRPVDPVGGPGWRLSMLPLDDGSTALSLVMSHYVCDGIGGVIAVTEAILGHDRALGYPPPRSRGALRAALVDAGRTARDMPGTVRSMVAAAREARRRRDDPRSATPHGARPSDRDDESVVLPAVIAHVDRGAWDSTAKSLGGTPNTLAAAWTTRLAERMARKRGEDGLLTMQILVSDRTVDDNRAVAVSLARAHMDPTNVTTDLRTTRAAVKEAIAAFKANPDESAHMAGLIPCAPQSMWRRLIDWAVDDPDQPTILSNLGDVGEVVTRPDGTQAEYGYARGVNQHFTRRRLERMGGHLQVLYLSMPAVGKISLSILGYRLDGDNSRAALQEMVEQTLADFGLTGELD